MRQGALSSCRFEGPLPLDQEGICAPFGSARLADSAEPSHVVKAMKPQTAASRQMIRFSLDRDNEVNQIGTTPASTVKAVRMLGS